MSGTDQSTESADRTAGGADGTEPGADRTAGGAHRTEPGAATVRCSFCRTLNRVDVSRAAERPRCGECERPMLLDRPVKVTEEDFEKTVRQAGVPVLVDFYADWCGPCKMVAPLVDEIAGEKSGKMLVAKVDTDRAERLSRELGIRGIPTLILFEDGEEVARSTGYEPEKVRRMVDRAA